MIPLSDAIKYAQDQRPRFLDELTHFCKIPSISNDEDYRDDVKRAAGWLADYFDKMGMQHTQIFPTGRHPIVYSEWLQAGSAAPTVLVYGHYDVQPAEPETLANWHSAPFEPVIKGENIYARGTTDMKGQILASVFAVEAYLKTGRLPVNVKFMIEGEEEIGSLHLVDFMKEQRDLLSCDVFLNPDTGMIAADLPTISYGLRGLAFFELYIYGPSKDLHSGAFGGAVHNPALALCQILAGVHDQNKRVLLPGFYDKVRELSFEDRAEIAQLPKDDNFYLQQTGVPALWGEVGYTSEERVGSRPTLEINGLYSGFIAVGTKTVLPSYAMAKISTRLVPDQYPDEINLMFQEYLKKNVPNTVSWELKYLGGSPASLSERSSPGIRAVTRAFESVWKKKPLFKREGGSVPVVLYAKEILGVETVNIGFSLPEDGMHGPDEKLHLPTWEKGIQALIHFFDNLNNQKDG
jgi:acetylornithine deacetylase/succinyl-diaminopimelate desuccinylase-like protein